MEPLKLGQLIDDKQGRDAVHVAIAPVIANEIIEPGEHIGFVIGDTQKASRHAKVKLGIADPFLTKRLLPADRFFMWLYPNTITSLRHEWTHPAFQEVANKSFSEQWLRVYAAKMNSYDPPDEAYQNLIKGLKSGELFANGSDLHGLYDLEDADELKQHAENVLGISVNWDGFSFRCPC